MVREIAWIVIAVGTLGAGTAIAAAALELRRTLRHVRADARRVADSVESALREWQAVAELVAETVHRCQHGLRGFEALAEGGRALGETAARAAAAVSGFIDAWMRGIFGVSDQERERDGSR